MAHEVDGLCGAKAHERSSDRENSRNGYRERGLQTRLGAVALKVPKLLLPVVERDARARTALKKGCFAFRVRRLGACRFRCEQALPAHG